MTNLERRALLGDREAQKQCIKEEIVLPCWRCGGKAKIEEVAMIGKPLYAVRCKKQSCGVYGIAHETVEKALEYWNTRPAPQIGRCVECKHLGERTVHETGEKENFCNHDKYGLFALDSTNAYCSYFEPKGGEFDD